MLPEAEKFDKSRWPAWKTKIIAHIKACRLGGYIDSTILNPAPTLLDGTEEAAGPTTPIAPPT
jgi:hypothetical protein